MSCTAVATAGEVQFGPGPWCRQPHVMEFQPRVSRQYRDALNRQYLACPDKPTGVLMGYVGSFVHQHKMLPVNIDTTPLRHPFPSRVGTKPPNIIAARHESAVLIRR